MQIARTNKPKVPFEEHSQRVIDEFRSALAVVLTSLDIDITRPQEAARQLGLNKNLTWKLSKVFTADDVSTAITHLPGSSGRNIFLKSLQKAGGSESQIVEVQRASLAFDTMVEAHVNDRSTLELVLDGIATDDAGALDVSRKLLFQGASGVWGVRAKTRYNAAFLAPSTQREDCVDMAHVRGFHEFMRLRNDVSWPLFRISGWGAAKDLNFYTSIGDDQAKHSTGPHLIREFCSPNLPEILETRDADSTECTLGPGPLGNLGAIDIAYGEASIAKIPKYAAKDDPYAEFGVIVSTPCENLLQDIYIHKDLDPSQGIESTVFGRPGGVGCSPYDPGPSGAGARLPIRADIKKIPGRTPTPDTRLVPQLADIVSDIFRKMKWDAGDFEGFRATLKYPPLSSFSTIKFRLPDAP